jgi:hypothetical protein
MSQHQQPSVTKAAEKTSSKAFSLVGLSSLVATISLIMILLGYGVSLAIETKFGLPHALLFESTTEIIDLASIAVMEIVTNCGKVLHGFDLVSRLYSDGWPVLTVVAVVVFCILCLVQWKARSRKPRGNQVAPKKNRWWLPPIVLGLCVISMPFIAALMVFATAAAGALIGVVPMMGHGAGLAYMEHWVIEPKECRPEKPQAGSGPYADCVVVMKDKEELGRGRVVLATSKALVLWVPGQHAQRVPTADTTVLAVSKL